MDDAVLVQRAAALDAAAFARLFDRHARRLHDYLCWVLQDRTEAAYVLYETFLEAGARLPDLEDPSKVRAWLFAIASDQALHHRRGETDGKAPVPGSAAPAPAPGTNGDGAWGELVDVVRGVAAGLSPRDRALLDLKYRQGFDDEELADATGTDADHASELAGRVGEDVEDLLSETVVAFLGRRDCPGLVELIGSDAAATLDARQRRLVDEHAETCERCGERRRRRIPPSSLIAASPAASIPLGLPERVKQDVQLGSQAGGAGSGRRHGFPPPIVGGVRDRDRLLAGVGVLVVLLFLAVFFLTRGHDGTQHVSANGGPRPTTVSSLPTTVSTIGDLGSTLPTDVPTLPPGGGSLGTALGVGAGGGGSGGSGGAGGGGGSGGGSGAAQSPSETAPPDTTPATTPPTNPPSTTTTAPDTTGPALSGLAVTPSAIKAGSKCSGSDATTGTITVHASDPSGVASVSFSVAGTSTANGGAMSSNGGGTYTASVGPFESQLPAGVTPTEVVVISAKDSLGNTSSTSGSIPLRCSA